MTLAACMDFADLSLLGCGDDVLATHLLVFCRNLIVVLHLFASVGIAQGKHHIGRAWLYTVVGIQVLGYRLVYLCYIGIYGTAHHSQYGCVDLIGRLQGLHVTDQL